MFEDTKLLYGRPRECYNKITQPIPSTNRKKKPLQTETTYLQINNIKIYRCVKGDIDRCEADVNITFYTPINLYIGLFKHQSLFYYFSVSNVWWILSKKKERSVILNLELSKLPWFSQKCCLFVYLFIYLFILVKHFYSFMLTLNTFEDVIKPFSR